ncbi:ATP-dependent DNA helicase PIF1 [Spathaspora sp. JA1]|nr:ATP-dependent DNA helicase PIF1 [Spathaspora sp. JA1]
MTTTQGKPRPTLSSKSQSKISSFFTSSRSVNANTSKTGTIPRGKSISGSLTRSDSFLSKAMTSTSGFDDPASSDTSFDTSTEINNFRNVAISKSFNGRYGQTTTTNNDRKPEVIEISDVEDEDVRPTQSFGLTQLKRSNTSDFLDNLSGQARKVPKLSRNNSSSTTTVDYGSAILSEEQNSVVQSVVYQKQNVFYTGSAGTGKSVVLRELVRKLKEIYRDNVGITASTGMAACNIQGQTLHKYLGIGLGAGSPFEISKRIKKHQPNLRKWQTVKVLIIDEISMIDGVLFDKLEEVARLVRGNSKPFGGIQIVCTGDFFQLPPVSKDGKASFCFQAKSWNNVIKKTILLRKVFRQKGDNELIDMLNALRFGKLQPETIQKFMRLSRRVSYQDGIEPTELFPTRNEVKRANFARLNQLNSKAYVFVADDNVVNPELKKQLDNLMCEQTLTLKEGAQVMNLKNMDDQLVNGSIGTVIFFSTTRLHLKVLEHYGPLESFTEEMLQEMKLLSTRIGGSASLTPEETSFIENMPAERKPIFQLLCHAAGQESADSILPVVNFKINGLDHIVLVEREEFKIELNTRKTLSSQAQGTPEALIRTQLPLLLSWAISIHKAQGQTIDRLRIDLGKSFEKGQVYVALSRATTKDHLEIRNFHPSKVMTSEITPNMGEEEEDRPTGDLGYSGFEVSLNYFTSLPDVASIASSELTVIFKSLLKKDPKTKEKALSDFLTYLESDENVAYTSDYLTIMAWIQTYPKLAIENSRSIRVLAHQVQANYLQKVGGKAFSKYLKSSLPVWLLGVFDTDKSVCSTAYSGLLESFQNDKSKVDEKIWILFADAIVNLIGNIVLIESPETMSDKRYTSESELNLKYERALSCSLNMLMRLISLANDDKISLESESTRIEYILNSEVLWDRLGSSIKEKTMNLPLFKTLLMLISKVFDMTKANIFITQVTDVKLIYKTVSKKFFKIKLVNDTKSSSGNIIYSNIILQFWSTIITLTDFTLRDVKKFKLKKNFWELGGSKGVSRFYEYLRVGSCNSDPIYYQLVSRLFDVFAKLSVSSEPTTVVDFVSEDEFEYTTGLLLKQFNSNQPKFKAPSLDCHFRIVETFKLPDSSKSGVIYETLVNVVNNLTTIRAQNFNDQIITTVASHFESNSDYLNESLTKLNSTIQNNIVDGNLASEFSLTVPEKNFVQKYFDLLQRLNKKELIEDIIKRIIQELEENSDTNLKLLLSVIKIYVETEDNFSQSVADFIEVLPAYVEEGFIDVPIDLFHTAISRQYIKTESQLVEIINDFYLKLTMVSPSSLNDFLYSLKGLVDIQPEQFEDLYSYVLDLSQSKDLNDQLIETILSITTQEEVLNNIISRARVDDKGSIHFIELVNRYNLLPKLLKTHGSKEFDRVLLTAWKNLKFQACKDFLVSLKEDQATFINSFHTFLTSCTINDDIPEIAKFISSGPVPISVLVEELKTISNQINVNAVAISNPLESAIYLCKKPKATNTSEFGPILGKFLVSLEPDCITDEVIILGLIVKEYISDYVFIQNSKAFDFVQVSEILNKLDVFLTDALKGVSFKDVVNTLNENSSSIITKLFSILEGNDTYAFYVARAVKKVIEATLENESLSQFESYEINYTKLIKFPFKFISVITGISRFLTSKKLDRVRQYVFSEILGVRKESDILNQGLKWITFSLLFYNIEDKADFLPIVKFTMVLNQISSWFDSSIAYDSEFIDVRIQVTRFLGFVLSKQLTIPDNYWDLTNRVLKDNLEVIQTEPDRIDLKYYTFKLYNLINKTRKESWDDLYEDLLEIFLSKDTFEVDNQATILTQQISQRALEESTIPTKVLIGEKMKLVSTFTTSNLISAQRVTASYLRRVILKEQEDFVVEYQLSKSKLSEDDQDKVEAKILDEFVAAVKDHKYAISELEEFDFTKYLWSWYLIFTYFEDSTFKIRSDYIGQLSKHNELRALFEFIAEHMDFSDRFFGTLVFKQDDDTQENRIPNYDLIKTARTEDLGYEIKYLIVHVFYKCLNYCGSEVQYWFKEIRDKQLKGKIEKCSSKYVSSILITSIMNQVLQEKDKIQGKEENLNIKVNQITNEIRTTYVIDEQKMEMVIKIPQEYPLANVTVEGPLRLGVKENQWKAWLLASQRVISLTNGSIIDSIELFCKNVNLHFSGFEDCAICYSILHQDLSLPSKTCPTCSNKFHAACLYKWFKSSGSSTCPLCRSAFAFRVGRS